MRAPRPLNILMTADAVGGVWQYATDLSSALADGGHRIIFALVGPSPTSEQRCALTRVRGIKVVETGLPLDWLAEGAEPVQLAAEELAALARRERVDVVHCNMPTLAGAARFPAPVVAVTHGCVATWWQAAKSEPLAAPYHWHREMMRRGLAAADAVVAPSASYAVAIRLLYRLRTLPRVVHNGRAAPEARPRSQSPTATVLTVGRQWDAVKNGALLDRLAGRLDVPFFAAGPMRGPHGETASFEHLQALGHVENAQLQELLAARPVFVSAATFEPFGLAVLEAAQAHCPLVLSDIPTFRELWDDAALFADPHDEVAFEQAIRRALHEPLLAQHLGQAAAKRAARFTPEATASAMETIYEGVLARHEAAA